MGPPRLHEFFEPGHQYTLTTAEVPAAPTTRKMQQAHIEEKRETQAKVTAEVEKSLGNLSEVFTGNRTVEGETSPTDPTRNVALWWLDNDDVESWCDKVPIDILTEWFLHPDHKEKFFNKMVREDNSNFVWTTALAWAADYYPLYGHGDTQGDPAGRGGRPNQKHTESWFWIKHLKVAIDWCIKHKEYGELRKSVSHIGGHLADYCRSELFARGGRAPHTYIVVHNGTYKYIYIAYKEILASQGCRTTELDQWISAADPLGDVFEIAVTHMFLQADHVAILGLDGVRAVGAGLL